MESEQKDLKMKLNDLEKNQKALMEMTYPKTMKPRTIVKARKSVTFKGGGSYLMTPLCRVSRLKKGAPPDTFVKYNIFNPQKRTKAKD